MKERFTAMKKALSILLALCLMLAAAAALAETDPIIGGWYIMLDYRDVPYQADVEGKTYMVYLMFFDDDGTISGISGERSTTTGLSALGSSIGTWSNDNGVYTANLVGIGAINPTIENDRLIVQMTEGVYYSMRRLELGSWYDDILYR
jgi:hypothetical protein